MEITKITKEEAIKDLDIVIKEDEFITKSGLPAELATLLHAAYRKGIDAYQRDYWNEKTKREEAEKKFTKLAVHLANQIITEEVTFEIKF